jgi:tetrahydromethanopterin S-methyltransferase subunit G
MEAARAIWTDERMDDLNHKVDKLDAEMRSEFRAVRSEMASEFQAVRSEMKSEFQVVHSRLDGIQRTMLTMTVSLAGTMVVGFASILATQL